KGQDAELVKIVDVKSPLAATHFMVQRTDYDFSHAGNGTVFPIYTSAEVMLGGGYWETRTLFLYALDMINMHRLHSRCSE
ncbi:hypothetical protein PFISCL1PPCAC_27905, partial [Pristionchus fissidentatus]